jgi:hypothetical protein
MAALEAAKKAKSQADLDNVIAAVYFGMNGFT